MPKKTKKEKIRAEHRRQQTVVSVMSQVQPVAVSQVKPFSFQLQPLQKPTETVKIQTNTVELSIIKSDLARTLLLAFIAISVEVGIFLMQHRV